MQVATAIAPVRELIRALPGPVAFVPTMGALHDGHLSLVDAAREHATGIVASVFVNPLQFGPTEDYAKYPRDYDGDFAKLAAAGVDVLFAPDATAMYPTGFSTTVDIGPMAHVFEGEIRKTHFAGVVTVVAKLLNIVQPDVLVLGQKDAQQTAVLRKLIRDLGYPVDVQIVPTSREPDGLARSSRNAFLTPEQRAAAPTLYAALVGMRDALLAGKSKYDATETADKILTEHALLDYFDIVDADTFEVLETLRPPAFVIGAARFGPTRLLDNLWIPD
ncbi:MAG TPA: pantoate--beta-alanine ligase [Candidatus Baltobacteraceae bacterium]|jgi:pantoate--beta-alanine ligase